MMTVSGSLTDSRVSYALLDFPIVGVAESAKAIPVPSFSQSLSTARCQVLSGGPDTSMNKTGRSHHPGDPHAPVGGGNGQ